MYVFDASVLMADLQPLEPHHAEARALIQHVTRNKIRVCCPNLALAEVAAGLARSTRRTTATERTVAALRHRERYEFVVIDDPLVDRAALIAARQQIRGCDAIYVALAETKGVPLVTLDQQQKTRTPIGVTAYTPAELMHLILRRRMR